MRFRRPRTPVNNSSNNSASGSTSHVNSASIINNNDPSSDITCTWPCSNCHATVSNQESRCPYCGGIQVKIPRSPLATTKALRSNLLLQRLAATPTTPGSRKQIDPNKIQAFLSESTTTSTMSFDEEEEEEDERQEQSQEEQENQQQLDGETEDRKSMDEVGGGGPERPASALSQLSSLSQNFNIPPQTLRHLPSPSPNKSASPASLEAYTPQSGKSSFVVFERPQDPVALTLETAAPSIRSGSSSPQVVLDETKQQQQQQQETATTKRKASTGSGFEVPKKKLVLPS